MLHNSELALIGGLNDVQPSAGDYEERGHIALLDQHFAFSYFAFTTEGDITLDLRSRELGEQLLAAFRRNGWQLLHWSGSHKAEFDARRGTKDIKTLAAVSVRQAIYFQILEVNVL